VELLNSILEDGDQGELLIALRQMTKVFGSLSKVAEKAQLNGTHIYRTLSAKGSPEILSLSAILKAMGLHLAVQPSSTRQRTHERRAALVTQPSWQALRLSPKKKGVMSQRRCGQCCGRRRASRRQGEIKPPARNVGRFLHGV